MTNLGADRKDAAASVVSDPTMTDGEFREGTPRLRGLSRGRVRRVLYQYGVVIVWLLLIAFFGVVEPSTFLTVPTFEVMFGTQSGLLFLGFALVLTLTVDQFDLSVAAVLGLSATVIAVLNTQHGWPIIPAVLAGLAVGPLVGVINGLIVVILDVDAIVVTLGMGTFLLGIAIFVSNSTSVGGISPELSAAMTTRIAGLPLAFFYSITCGLAVWYVLKYTPLGRHMLFVGRNPDVARLAGVRVRRIQFGAYIASGLISAMAGVVTLGLSGGIEADSTAVLLLPAFAAVFLGAAVIEPGRFNVWGTVIAIYFLITGITGLQLMGFSGWIGDAFYGGALVVAVTVSRVLAGRAKV